MDRIAALRAFLTVADQGSFSEAARRLRWSPAAVTRAVATLESDLGLTLLNRTTRSVRLTERGAIYLESVRQVLTDLEDADRRVRGEDAAPRGPMTVAAPVMFGRLHVLPIVERLLRAYPELSVKMTMSDRSVHLVDEEIDVAVRIGELADSAMQAVKVGEVRRVVVASPAYLSGRPIPATPADLAAHDIIAFEGVDAVDEWRFGTDGPTSIRVEPRLRVNTADAAIIACKNGMGVTRALSYQVHDAVAAGALTLLLEAFAPAPIPVHVIHPQRRFGSANVSAFTKVARDYFRTSPISGV
jgi:DNA-binding transcriptional LysR family regulator